MLSLDWEHGFVHGCVSWWLSKLSWNVLQPLETLESVKPWNALTLLETKWFWNACDTQGHAHHFKSSKSMCCCNSWNCCWLLPSLETVLKPVAKSWNSWNCWNSKTQLEIDGQWICWFLQDFCQLQIQQVRGDEVKIQLSKLWPVHLWTDATVLTNIWTMQCLHIQASVKQLGSVRLSNLPIS